MRIRRGASDDAAAKREHAIAVARSAHETEPGWSWNAAHVAGAPGWHSVWQHGREPHDILFGGVTFVGPSDLLVRVSSNPLIHNFDDTIAVLAELGDGVMSGPALVQEIAQRTDARRTVGDPR